MVRTEYLAMKTDQIAAETLNSDMKEFGLAAKKLASHAMLLGGLAIGTAVLQWVAVAAAVYLMVLGETKYKPNILSALLVPYIFFTLPSPLFIILSGEISKGISLISVLLQLFFPQHFPNWPGKIGSTFLVLAIAPLIIGEALRGNWIGNAICVIIACYHLQEHIRKSGGFKQSFTTLIGLAHTTGVILMIVYPIWALVLNFI
ncbi:hypothetical protein MKW94_016170 [Papaver nudicaule]|uniref:Uncharacterized protein n=1 Tax=Papaver nudicaule TaxID=74823 RepID=A0AA41SAN3_PAPNU|nr:hypothetical protein [Papaver nudicaule]